MSRKSLGPTMGVYQIQIPLTLRRAAIAKARSLDVYLSDVVALAIRDFVDSDVPKRDIDRLKQHRRDK